MIKKRCRDTRLEINLDNIEYNFRLLKKEIGSAKFISVVKANFYGAGIRGLWNFMEELGADIFATATLSEAIELRDLGASIPILIMGYTPTEDYEYALKNDVMLSVFDLEEAKVLNDVAMDMDTTAKVHISLDTGMTRLGIREDEDVQNIIININDLSNISIQGVYTHFTESEVEDSEVTNHQLEKFMEMCKSVEKDVDLGIKHISNSAAVFSKHESVLDGVRNAATPLGYHTGEPLAELKPSLELKTKITRIRTVAPGTKISYNGTYTTKDEEKIATLSIGYADGMLRSFSNKGYVTVDGHKAPIRGTICMDQMMIDVTGIDCAVGDDVVIYGYTPGTITIDEQASLIGSINTELTTLISRRVPRVYLKNGKIVQIIDYLLD